MGLDAFIFCDCYEKGLLREPPPAGVTLCVEPDGSLGREQEDGTFESDLIWDEWREQPKPCAAANGGGPSRLQSARLVAAAAELGSFGSKR
jgi:hypothetical protein